MAEGTSEEGTRETYHGVIMAPFLLGSWSLLHSVTQIRKLGKGTGVSVGAAPPPAWSRPLDFSEWYRQSSPLVGGPSILPQGHLF